MANYVHKSPTKLFVFFFIFIIIIDNNGGRIVCFENFWYDFFSDNVNKRTQQQ